MTMVITWTAVLVHPKTMAVGAVFHGSVVTWAALADGAGSTDTVKVALIGALALVLAAAVPALIGLLRKEGETRSVADARKANTRLVAEITADRTKAEADRDEWKATAEAAIRGTEIRDLEINRLRGLIVGLGGNPFPPPVEPAGVKA